MNRSTNKRISISEEEIISVFSSIRDKDEMNRFFREILTPSEIRNLSLRWELMKRLKQGIPQRKIASDLRISLCKITRGSKIVKNQSSVSNQYIKNETTKEGTA